MIQTEPLLSCPGNEGFSFLRRIGDVHAYIHDSGDII